MLIKAVKNAFRILLEGAKKQGKGSPCGECAALSAHVDNLSQTVWNLKPHTNYKYLGLANMQDIAQSYAEQARQLKLQVCLLLSMPVCVLANSTPTQGLNASHEYISVLTRLDDYHRLLMTISEHGIPRLQQIVSVALGNGASVHEIINKLEDALEGAYCPWGYGADDLDITTLVYRLGGCQLLFALNQKLSILSLRTLRT